MKKSTIAVAALLTALSAAPVVSVAYAEDTTQNSSTGNGCAGCAAAPCSGSQGTDTPCKGSSESSTNDTDTCKGNSCGGNH